MKNTILGIFTLILLVETFSIVGFGQSITAITAANAPAGTGSRAVEKGW